MYNFEEIKDRAIAHCRFLVEHVRKNSHSVQRAWAKVDAFYDIGIFTIDEAAEWHDRIRRAAWEGCLI